MNSTRVVPVEAVSEIMELVNQVSAAVGFTQRVELRKAIKAKIEAIAAPPADDAQGDDARDAGRWRALCAELCKPDSWLRVVVNFHDDDIDQDVDGLTALMDVPDSAAKAQAVPNG